MNQRQTQAMGRLQALAALRKEAALAKLATVAQSRSRLLAALAALKGAEAPLGTPEPASDAAPGTAAFGIAVDPAMIGARLAHRRWIEAQQRRLNQQLALVTADYLRQKPAAVRAFGQAMVLEKLHQHAVADLRLKKIRARD